MRRKERFHRKRGIFQLAPEALQLIDFLVEVSGIELPTEKLIKAGFRLIRFF
jgi:hypothetical protein